MLRSTELVFSSSVAQGSPLFINVVSDKLLAGSRIRLEYGNGGISPFFQAYDPRPDFLGALKETPENAFMYLGVNSAASFLIGIPPDTEPGSARVFLFSALGELLAERGLEIIPRKYVSEDIKLSAALTGIRADPDPRKDEQARRYAALLALSNPSGVYLDAPFIKPLNSEHRTSFFGDHRRYLYSTGAMAFSMHAGVDFGVPVGTPLVAAGRGRVVMAEFRIVTGNTLVLEHLPGVYSIYMHMDTLAVAMDQVVARGAPIGTVGMTGLATGPHLHWELRIAEIPCDPESLIGIDNFPDIGTMIQRLKGGDFYQPNYDRRQ